MLKKLEEFVLPEVQVGFDRVGDAFWGFELQDVVPDIVIGESILVTDTHL